MRLVLLLGVVACSAGPTMLGGDAGSPAVPDAAWPDAAMQVPLDGFGTLSGMCGVLAATDLTSPTPELVRDTFTFARAYVDPDDRPLLTAGGQQLAEIPNAGGNSQLSEVFAFEELARCELATLLKTETEIVYDGTGKITDFEVQLDAHKIGVSVTRAMTYPLGGTYTAAMATDLVSRKLTDIQASSAHVSAGDRWDKQILAVLAWDDQAADAIAQAWAGLDASVQADTIVIVSSTAGEDLFIYTNM